MNDLKKLKELALKVKQIEGISFYTKAIVAEQKFKDSVTPDEVIAIIDRLEAAEAELARLKEQEPIAWVVMAPQGGYFERNPDVIAHLEGCGLTKCKPLYAAPHQSALPNQSIVSDNNFKRGLNDLSDCLDDCCDSEQGLMLALRSIRKVTVGRLQNEQICRNNCCCGASATDQDTDE